MEKLKNFDPTLDLEWLGDHWVIIDTTKTLAVHEVKQGPISYFRKVHDRIFHLQKDRVPDSASIINQLQYMRTDRFGDHKNLKKRLQDQLDAGEKSQKRTEEDFEDTVSKELKKIKNFGVVVPGRRDELNDKRTKNGDAD